MKKLLFIAAFFLIQLSSPNIRLILDLVRNNFLLIFMI